MIELKNLQLNQFNWFIFFSLSILCTISIFSGAFAATIAEKKGRAFVSHFFIGLILPIIYPIMIGGGMKSKLKTKVVKKEVAEEDDEYPDLDIAIDINAEFFKRYPADKDGLRPGPFMFETDNGLIVAQTITEINEAFLTILTKNSKSGKDQKLRLPFNKIISCNT